MLPDESVIRLTVARYYTPSGRLIQKSYKNGVEEYQKEIYERYEHGEFSHPDSIKFPDSLKYKTLIKKRTVYGGGGIMPDIFVPIDTSAYSNYFRDLIRKGILNEFVLQYVDKNRDILKSTYPDFNKYSREFNVGKDIFTALIDYATKEGLVFDQSGFDISENQLKSTIKAYIARDIWSTSEFYEIMNQTDKNFLKALEVMKNWDEFQKKLKL